MASLNERGREGGGWVREKEGGREEGGEKGGRGRHLHYSTHDESCYMCMYMYMYTFEPVKKLASL